MNENLLNKGKLFNKNFMLFWNGQIISSIGSQIYYMAIILWITEVTDSASLLGLMGMISGIPTILLSAIGGTLADRFSRKNILLFCDVINAIVVFVLAYIFFAKGEDTSFIVASIIGVSFISSVIASFFTPAASAAIPDLVPEEKLTAANSFRQSAFQVATIAGWTVSSFLYVAIGIIALSIINALTFVVGAITKYYVHIPQKRIVKKENSKNEFFGADLKEGLKYVWDNKGLKKIVVASIIINFFAIPTSILLPFYVKDQLLAEQHWLPFLMSFSMGGSMLGLILAGTVNLSATKRRTAISIAMLINALLVVMLGINNLIVGAILILVLTGASAGFIQVHIQTIMQLSTAQEIRGRVFGFISTITGALTPLGMGLSGVIGDLTDKNFLLIFGISGAVLFLVALYTVLNDDIREFLAYSKNEKEETSTTDIVDTDLENFDEKINNIVTQIKK